MNNIIMYGGVRSGKSQNAKLLNEQYYKEHKKEIDKWKADYKEQCEIMKGWRSLEKLCDIILYGGEI